MNFRRALAGLLAAIVGVGGVGVALAGGAQALSTGRVLADPCLNLRAGYDHNTGWDTMLGCIPINATVTIECVNDGLLVYGPYGSETIWDRTTWNGMTGYVSDAWVYTGINGAVAPVCVSVSPLPPPPPPPPTFDAVGQTDRLLFHSSMATFLDARSSGLGGSALDWSTDGCSVGPIQEPARSQPRGYDFRGACWRHDFGYRNYKRQNRLTEPARQTIDDNFHTDMYRVCSQYSGWRSARGVECRRIADVFYAVVRACGQNPAPACPSEVPGLRRIFA